MRKLRLSTSAIAFLSVLASGRTSRAANICDETVPSNRMVDGFPAYAQCAAASGSAIYSNNGIDTATSSGGTGWVRTQGSGGYQCTEWAHRYLYFRWNVQGVPNGNAGTWCDGTIPSGLAKTTTPMHGDLIVFAPGSCGADPTTGHVAVVDVVNSNATVTFVEQNGANRRSCAISTAACFLHATANDGTSLDGGTPDGAAPDAAGGNGGSTGQEVSADSRRADATGGGGLAGTGGGLAAGGASGSGGAVASGGQVGTGGAVGSGGASSTGGLASSGGTIGSGGVSGSGGLATGTTGPSDVSSTGCACRLVGHRSARQVADGWAGLALLLAALVVFRRPARPRK